MASSASSVNSTATTTKTTTKTTATTAKGEVKGEEPKTKEKEKEEKSAKNPYGSYRLNKEAKPPKRPFRGKMVIELEKKNKNAFYCGLVGAGLSVVFAITAFFLLKVIGGLFYSEPNIKKHNLT